MRSVDSMSPGPASADVTFISSSRISSLALNQSANLFAATSPVNDFVAIGTVDPGSGSFGETAAKLKGSRRPLSALFMDDERNNQSLVLVGSSSGIDIIDAQSGTVFRQLKGKGGATSLYSWLGCMVAAGDARGGVTLWDARVNEPVAHFVSPSTGPHQKSVFSVDCTARVLAMAGSRGAVHLFDITARKHIIDKYVCPFDVKALRFSPRMRLLLAADTQSLYMMNFAEISTTLPQPSLNILSLPSITGVLWDHLSCRFVVSAGDHFLRLFQLDASDTR